MIIDFINRSFQEVSESLPEPQRSNARFCKQLDPTDDTGRDMGQREYILVSLRSFALAGNSV